jgi:hypothetical protein
MLRNQITYSAKIPKPLFLYNISQSFFWFLFYQQSPNSGESGKEAN